MNKSTNTMTEYIKLTEMWQDGSYLKVGEVIAEEDWSHARVAEFCSYVAKHLGLIQLNLLHKFL